MELWIRSQDKTILSKAHDLVIRENRNEKNETDYFIVDTYTLGKYKSNERALKVLNEIHQRLIDLQALEITSDYYSTSERPLECVYEMPKE